ncbi:MAG: hypothetical protein IJ832_03530, partial [Bacteroidaceae bacterium]|nr:hypothetical protein [Bacteroidaceae bacterium]
SRHGRLDASIILLIWLSEKVGFFATTFSRHGRLDASIILLIWLSEKVGKMGVKTEITQYEKPANLALREGLAGL